MRTPRLSVTLNICAFLTWVIVVGYGLTKMWLYDDTPGKAAQATDWPSRIASIAPQLVLTTDGRDTLVMLAHPRCPCTEAGVENLAHVMAISQGHLRAYVVLYEPSSSSGEQWTQSALVQNAQRIPGVTTIMDPHGRLASTFHAMTSGQTLLYDKFGRLLFSGGITGERGLAGDCAGSESVASLALGQQPEVRSSPVYGCSLVDVPQDDSDTFERRG